MGGRVLYAYSPVVKPTTIGLGIGNLGRRIRDGDDATVIVSGICKRYEFRDAALNHTSFSKMALFKPAIFQLAIFMSSDLTVLSLFVGSRPKS
ncbi:hypothetical protein DPMN_080042 [Dreissena polymorpha]|uniref:Uncharacterized protein n=1 Tax=Dreissena polymorpha TaxID=45954 RepID=A0A9D3YTQ4_DREPO|nr:hypothetical protein DPMN_080042 [Dreissena polymorpha]